MPAKKKTFEEQLADLDRIATQMERGELDLADSLKHFEQGIKIARQCQKTLHSAEQKVSRLVEEEGDLFTMPFLDEDDDINDDE